MEQQKNAAVVENLIDGEITMRNFLKIAFVSLAVIGGISSAQAVHPDDKATFADKYFDQQTKIGG